MENRKAKHDSDGGEETQPQSSIVSARSIALFKGGSAIRGIGEKFAVNPIASAASMSVPICTSRGRLGFGPQLALAYDPGAGNGPFGSGWSLYWSKSCGADANFGGSKLQRSFDFGCPLNVDQFSKFGGFPCKAPRGTSICRLGEEIEYRTILKRCHKYEIGWYAWEWRSGNGQGDPSGPASRSHGYDARSAVRAFDAGLGAGSRADDPLEHPGHIAYPPTSLEDHAPHPELDA